MVTPSFSKGSLFGEYLIVAFLPWQSPIQRYRATHISTDIDVLLSCLDVRNVDVIQEQRLAFAEKVKQLRAASHLHLPRIVDGGSDDGFQWVASEFVDGLSLRDVMATSKTIRSVNALALACAIAEALKAAHALGVQHGWLAPDRVLVTEGLELRTLADFGLYYLFGHPPVRPSEIAYRPPEQLDGDEIDHRADIYTLGMILYAALALDEPYAGAARRRPDDIDRLARHELPPPLAKLRAPPFPAFLDDLVRRLSAKEKALRPATWDMAISLLNEIGDREIAYQVALDMLTARCSAGSTEIGKKVDELPATESHTGFRLRPDLEAALRGEALPEIDSTESSPTLEALARAAEEDVAEESAPGEVIASVPDVVLEVASAVPSAEGAEIAPQPASVHRDAQPPPTPTPTPRAAPQAPAPESAPRRSRSLTVHPAAGFLHPIAMVASLALLLGVSLTLGWSVFGRERDSVREAAPEAAQTAEPAPPLTPMIAKVEGPTPTSAPSTSPVIRAEDGMSAPPRSARIAPKAPRAASRGGAIPVDLADRVESAWAPAVSPETH